MKSFLQKIGVLESDKEPAPRNTVVEVQSTVSPAVTGTRQVSALEILSDQKVSEDEKLDPEEVSKSMASLELILGTQVPTLKLFHDFIEAASKLVRVTDLRTKYQATLDILGVDAKDVLMSAHEYPIELTNVLTVGLGAYTNGVKPIWDHINEEADTLQVQRQALEKEMAKLNVMIEANDNRRKVQALEDKTKAGIVHKAGSEVLSNFNAVLKQLEANL